jgi:hypothetical protein
LLERLDVPLAQRSAGADDPAADDEDVQLAVRLHRGQRGRSRLRRQLNNRHF